MSRQDELHHSICSCTSSEHTLRWSYDSEYEEFYTEVYLHQYRSLPKRVWVALKYVLGYKCRYGHWDCTLLDKAEAIKLRDFINEHIYGTRAGNSGQT